MGKWKPTPEEEAIIRKMEQYEGRKFPEVTKEQMEAARQKLLEWDADEWPVDEIVEALKVGLPGNGSSLYVGPDSKQIKHRKK